jgi:DNA-binding IclR family transcriptional regulator
MTASDAAIVGVYGALRHEWQRARAAGIASVMASRHDGATHLSIAVAGHDTAAAAALVLELAIEQVGPEGAETLAELLPRVHYGYRLED